MALFQLIYMLQYLRFIVKRENLGFNFTQVAEQNLRINVLFPRVWHISPQLNSTLGPRVGCPASKVCCKQKLHFKAPNFLKTVVQT